MRNVLWMLLSLILLAACADPQGNESKVSPAAVNTGDRGTPFRPAPPIVVNGQPIRENTLKIEQAEVVHTGSDIEISGMLRLQNSSEISVKLKGKVTEDGSAWLYDDSHPQLSARLFCLDERSGVENCQEFYVNSFFQASGEILSGQTTFLKEVSGVPEISSSTSTTILVQEDFDQTEYEAIPIRIQEPISPQEKAQFSVLSPLDRETLARQSRGSVATTTTTLKQGPSTTTTNSISPRRTETSRPTDQAVKKPFDGWMRNATDFLMLSKSATATFNILWPEKKHFFGTWDLKILIQELGEFIGHRIPGYKLTLGAISAKSGGELRGHSSHQNGLDADIAYIVDNRSLDFRPVVEKGRVNAAFRAQDQWDLIKRAFSTGAVEMMFVDPAIKSALCKTAKATRDLVDSKDRGVGYQILRRLKPYPMHHHHFHVRIRCSEDQPRCLQDSYYFADSGCF
ncbi:MAG: penicillin-insensitive murein endopeptidase [Proteobacteria bacterium]|nr:penicillin-insensitive murein endopeptidase [Pseudomonadota bacterium]